MTFWSWLGSIIGGILCFLAGRWTVGVGLSRRPRAIRTERLDTATDFDADDFIRIREIRSSSARSSSWVATCSPQDPCGGRHCGQCAGVLGTVVQVQSTAETDFLPRVGRLEQLWVDDEST
jgi:hypothetical protein